MNYKNPYEDKQEITAYLGSGDTKSILNKNNVKRFNEDFKEVS